MMWKAIDASIINALKYQQFVIIDFIFADSWQNFRLYRVHHTDS